MGPHTRPPASRETDITEEIEAALRGEVHMSAVSGNGNGGGKQWVMQLLQSLILAGIVGLFGMAFSLKTDVAEIRATQDERGKSNERDFERIDATLTRHDQRITDLERSQGSRELDAHHR